ncbi:MAG: carbohydrate ABC transporter permease [Armatimonadetes bacterium]|nr:carbohydrate ABC transporter permease [Armatimonadota bacterium]
MPLVGKVGRKRFRARFAMAMVYLLLIAGAITTVYPFLIMVTTGFKGPTDQNDNKLVPSYWSDNEELLAKYRDDKYSGSLELMTTMGIGDSADTQGYDEFLMSLPPDQWIAGFKTPSNQVTSRLTQRWQQFLEKKYGTVESVNAAFNEINGAMQLVSPPPERLEIKGWEPKLDQKWKDWLEFKNTLPAEFRIPITGQRLWQDYLRTDTKNQFDALPEEAKEGASKFEEIAYPSDHKRRALILDEVVPVAFQSAGTIEQQWEAQGHDLPLPIAAAEKNLVATSEKSLRQEFTWRNYNYVLDYVLINGRAVVNTAIFCILTILIQLTVNPLAAYALSRFPMKSTGKILLFLLATMAFPAEVAMIPSFLLLKDLGLLNTFAALVLPTAASGYMIFLLKGFFDSLPQEVFESGQIDGAPEWLMMLKIAFPLSKPVFGYMALLAFMGAYGAFLYAFLVAQDRSMWTLMVFIYQLQLIAPRAVMMAAVTIAAVPTLFVFLAAQRVIMRGIVLPGER